MRRRELFDLIGKGESLTVEFKQKFPEQEKIAKEMIAFANTRGGIIIFGVKDDKTICGVESEKEISELLIDTVKNFCEPPVEYSIEFFEVDAKEIVVCKINESNIKPHRIQDFKTQFELNEAIVYIRVNDKSVPASKEMKKILRVQSTDSALKNYTIGKIEKAAFEYLDLNEKITVKELNIAANISSRRASRALVKLVQAGILIIHTKENGDEFFTYAG